MHSKKCQQALKKAAPQKRAAFMERFQELPAQHCRREIRLVYASKSQFHRDAELGYTWAAKNKKVWRVSDSAPLFDRMDWDGVSWHRAKSVQVAAKLGLTLIPLPAYSPDLNPIDNLWRQMREEVTRLWPKSKLEPEYGKLVVSK